MTSLNKILFIRPQAPGPRFIPFGILYLVGYLKKNKFPVEINIFDLRDLSLTNDQITEHIKNYAPDLIGISSLSNESVFTHQLVETCHKSLPDVPIILGGPYAAAEWRYALKDRDIDYCVVGEGEETFLEVLNALENGNNPSIVDGVASRDKKGNPLLNNPRKFIQNLDEIPFPAYEMLDVKDYFSKVNSHLTAFSLKRHTAPIFTSRGCPYRCTFCHDIFGKKIRYRSVGNVIDEIDLLVGKYGVEEIHFEDDSFNINMKRAKNICNEILKKNYNLKFAFPNGIRADYVDEELIDLFYHIGVYSIAYGIESTSETVCKSIKKSLNIEKLNRAIEITAKRGIVVSGYFMIGFPNETEKEMEDTIRFACQSRLHISTFSRVIPFPGTELYNEVLRLGFKYNRKMFDKITYEKISINFSALSDELLESKIRSALRRFYLNPARLIRIFLVYPNKSRLIAEGLRVLTRKILR